MNLLLVAGARPNFMKVAPIIHEILRRRTTDANASLNYKLVHTGQHYDPQMSQVFFDELKIPTPDIYLDVGSGSHAVQTARILERFEPALLGAFQDPNPKTGTNRSTTLPDWLVVVGDVNSTMACTLVATKLGVRVAHVEAGLRSNDRSMPEEINRLVTDAISDLLLTPSSDADDNLKREGVSDSKIRLVGNVMIDSLIANLPRARESRIGQDLGIGAGEFVYLTLHRPSNVDDPATLGTILTGLKHVTSRLPVIFPVHPRTRRTLSESPLLATVPNIQLIAPVGYHDSLYLTENARIVITDSGGLQEESTYFRTPCLTLRPNTERPVTISIGSNRLTTPALLARDVDHILSQARRIGSVPPYWDGATAGRILDALISA